MTRDPNAPEALAALSWEAAPAAPALAAEGLHLWRIRPRAQLSASEASAAVALLDAGQRARVERLSQPEQRRRALQVQAALRCILARYLERAPASLALARAPTGKPFLAEPDSDLVFNLTTCAELALLAVGRGAPLGIDCEPIRLPRHAEAIAARLFTPQQRAWFAAQPEAERALAFTHCWTALEADAKCDGRGLFGARAPQSPIPEIRHAIPAPRHIAAVARPVLPAPDTWGCFEFSDQY